MDIKNKPKVKINYIHVDYIFTPALMFAMVQDKVYITENQ